MATATQQLLDLVRVAQNCTDYRAAKLLGISDASVSRWRTGGGHMSAGTIVKACNLAGEKNVGRWQIFIGAERELGPDGDWYRDMRADMLKAEAGEKLDKSSSLSVLLRGLRTRTAAVILSAAMMLGLSGLSPENTAFAASSGADANSLQCILCQFRSDHLATQPALQSPPATPSCPLAC